MSLDNLAIDTQVNPGRMELAAWLEETNEQRKQNKTNRTKKVLMKHIKTKQATANQHAQSNKQTSTRANRHASKQANRQTNNQTAKQASKETHNQASKQNAANQNTNKHTSNKTESAFNSSPWSHEGSAHRWLPRQRGVRCTSPGSPIFGPREAEVMGKPRIYDAATCACDYVYIQVFMAHTPQ